MKNQDIPASPVPHETLTEMPSLCVTESMGETKYEKAFWQVYSAIVSDPSLDHATTEQMADFAIKAVNAGFKALGKRND